MFNKYLKLNIRILTDKIDELISSREKQEKLNKDNEVKMYQVMENQDVLFAMLIKLADCLQLEFKDGKFVSKRGRKKRRK